MSYHRDINVKYWNGSVFNESDELVPAEINENFYIPLLDETLSYICAIERLELSSNTITYYDPDDDVADLDNYTENNNFSKVMIVLPGNVVWRLYIKKCYNLQDIVYQLNHEIERHILVGEPINVVFGLDDVGRFGMYHKSHEETYPPTKVYIPKILRYIVGLPHENILYPNTEIKSTYPREDMGSRTQLIRINSNIPFLSDIVGNSPENVLTDLQANFGSVSVSYSKYDDINVNNENDSTTLMPIQASSFSREIPQKLTYNPFQYRYINMLGQTPLNSINIKAWIVTRKDQLKPLYLDTGGIFRVKLAFFQR